VAAEEAREGGGTNVRINPDGGKKESIWVSVFRRGRVLLRRFAELFRIVEQKKEENREIIYNFLKSFPGGGKGERKRKTYAEPNDLQMHPG